ncbi:MAG: hypothetical protein J5787_04995 [Alphaproteobacteria bacterium]|nr:hypothetical protein [Alphaproteobacteria bacterium]
MSENEDIMALLEEFDVNDKKSLTNLKKIKNVYNASYDQRYKEIKIANKLFAHLETAIRGRKVKDGRGESQKNQLKKDNEKLSNKIENLGKIIEDLENNGKLSSDSLEDMIKILEEEGYSIHKAGETIAIMTDELPDQLRNKIQDEKLRTGKTVTYEKKKEIVMNALKKISEN